MYKGESSCWVSDNSNRYDRELRVWVQWCLSLLSGVYHFVHHILPAKICLPQLLSLPQKRWHQFCIQMAHLNLEQFKRLPLQVIRQTGKEALGSAQSCKVNSVAPKVVTLSPVNHISCLTCYFAHNLKSSCISNHEVCTRNHILTASMKSYLASYGCRGCVLILH